MRIDREQAVRLLGRARVARLGTVGRDGQPHLVPVTFALPDDSGGRIATAVDHKPKSTTSLRRLRNIERNPLVSVLADHYSENWEELWWVRADGEASVRTAEEVPEAVRALAGKYEQYREHPPEASVIVIAVRRITGWAATAS
ncbi:TIGR03668 family PPOX class F420-dependent oxidoreductase [Actinopolyspora erythraea]|uniref:F420-dependent protein n=1 Tax=Actinopolyspora erythraea TaxID=414996 RepID=A0A099DAN2_9ACTN|nr:TIGR03668 family PPOX class F420-dependent oxidoreductase [Actinopolyspora erythraea]ASU80223.1 TIGR03668 family PPOX class F420-dependent oxidoreductase [Actinopolyspora erythraea]KGI82415.1 F420-dependent protein [Actinopolyspora erythraea]